MCGCPRIPIHAEVDGEHSWGVIGHMVTMVVGGRLVVGT